MTKKIQRCFRLARKKFGDVLADVNYSAAVEKFRGLQVYKWSCLVAIDQSKAFDCINHHLFLNALQSCLLDFNSLKWLASYISHHMQQVNYAGVLSDIIPLISGVAQGSNLGPTLWNIYINCLFHILLYESVEAYADDIAIVTHGNTAAECAC